MKTFLHATIKTDTVFLSTHVFPLVYRVTSPDQTPAASQPISGYLIAIYLFIFEKSTFTHSEIIMVLMQEYKNIPFHDQFLCQGTRLPFPPITCEESRVLGYYFNLCVGVLCTQCTVCLTCSEC